MKINLRQLIKEELSSFINETPESDNANKKTIEAKKAQILALQKELATLQKGGIMNEDEQLNEMPYIGGTKDTTGLGTILASSANRLKKEDPTLTVQDIAKILKNKKSRLERAPELEKALRDQEEKLGGSPNYTPDLGPNQTLGAVEKALGLREPKEPKAKAEPKAKPNKPAKETSVKSDKSKKTSPKPTSKKEDDDEDVEIEDTYYNDDDTSLPDEEADDKKAAKAAAKAEKEFQGKTTTAKSLTPEKEERYQKLSKGIKAKVAKLENLSTNARAKSPDISVLKQLINKKEVKDLFKAKGVDLNALVASVIN